MIRLQNAPKFLKGVLALQPVRGLGTGDEIHAPVRKSRGFCRTADADEIGETSKIVFSRQAHVLIGLYSEHAIAVFEQQTRKKPRPRRDVGDNEFVRQTAFRSQNVDDLLGIRGPEPDVVFDQRREALGGRGIQHVSITSRRVARCTTRVDLVTVSTPMRLVIKVGTSLIAPGGNIDTRQLRALIDQLDLKRDEILIVSSGAIASGMAHLGLKEKPTSVPLMQACAAVGQSALMHTYEQLFFGKKPVAQLLLSSDDFTTTVRYKNLQNTLRQLIKLGVVPIVNENDSVSVRELEGAFGDNDELSALLAAAVEADWLLLLTDVDGFYETVAKKQRLVRTIKKLTPEMEALCNGHSKLGRGGMRSKLRAAKSASEAGVNVAIVNGRDPQVIEQALACKIGTYFPPAGKRD
jgi:glutamate 5-kinase